MHAQIDRLAYAHTSFFTTRGRPRSWPITLIARAPAGMAHVYFVSGGSEAIEAALKLARQYFVEIGEPQRRHFIARRQSYHGNTLGALAVGGNEWRRQAVRAAPDRRDARVALLRIPRPPRRTRRRKPTASASRASSRTTIERLGPRNVIAFVAEPVVGATLGAVPPVPGYFKRVREICDRHGILLIADEVMCGMGRTGTLYAVRAGRHRARPDGDRQGAGRRLPADRRRARPAADRRRRCEAAAASSSTATPISATRSACAAALAVQTGDRARRPARRGEDAGRAPRRAAARDASASIRTSATSAAAALSWRSSWSRTAPTKRPFDPALQAACAASRPRRWRAG